MKNLYDEFLEEYYDEKGYPIKCFVCGHDDQNIVYWNVRDSKSIFQDDSNGTGYCMVSGYSPSLFKSVIMSTEYIEQEDGTTKEVIDPITIMMNTLNDERYDRIKI